MDIQSDKIDMEAVNRGNDDTLGYIKSPEQRAVNKKPSTIWGTIGNSIVTIGAIALPTLFIYQFAVFYVNHAMYPSLPPEERIKLFGRLDW
jgi:hypothetical protein